MFFEVVVFLSLRCFCSEFIYFKWSLYGTVRLIPDNPAPFFANKTTSPSVPNAWHKRTTSTSSFNSQKRILDWRNKWRLFSRREEMIFEKLSSRNASGDSETKSIDSNRSLRDRSAGIVLRNYSDYIRSKKNEVETTFWDTWFVALRNCSGTSGNSECERDFFYRTTESNGLIWELDFPPKECDAIKL